MKKIKYKYHRFGREENIVHSYTRGAFVNAIHTLEIHGAFHMQISLFQYLQMVAARASAFFMGKYLHLLSKREGLMVWSGIGRDARIGARPLLISGRDKQGGHCSACPRVGFGCDAQNVLESSAHSILC